MTDPGTPIPILDNPYDLFGQWFGLAQASEPSDPNAMTLATADAHGLPDARIVLMKAYDNDGFVFYTNAQSRKGGDLAANPNAAVCFHWKTLARQIRASGPVEKVSDTESDAYFASRPYLSRVAASSSLQSQEMESRDDFEKRMAATAALYPDPPGDVPRPAHWHGFRLRPSRIEFWHEVAFRQHHRLQYTRDAKTPSGWRTGWLYP